MVASPTAAIHPFTRSGVHRVVGPNTVTAQSSAAALDYRCATDASAEAPPVDRTFVRAKPQPGRSPAVQCPQSLTQLERQRFHTLYCEHFDFVFRNLRRLGVAPASLDDALQDVYLVVLRRIRDLQHDAHVKAWLFAIIFRVAGNHRRSVRRRGLPEPLSDMHLPSMQLGPFDLAARAQASQFLHGFLNNLDDNRRAVFVMAELEQLTVPEIAKVLSANVNTVYSWLRAARIAFSRALQTIHKAGGSNHG